ncbi:MAG: PTS cellobiose transporter subunit IIC [Paludibacter sp.]|nr:PTS cellobiose transporter subunit IIC [Paludibacter sp.]
MINAINHTFFYNEIATDFETRVLTLLNKLHADPHIIRLIFISTSTVETYDEEFTIISLLVKAKFGERSPLVSYIIQSPPNPGEMILEVHYLPSGISDESFSYKQKNKLHYLLIENEESRMLILDHVRSSSLISSVTEQSSEIFSIIESVLEDEQMQVENIIRQWNYIGDITEDEVGVQCYHAFNEARSVFYDKGNWTCCGYPAATGIGMEMKGVFVSLIALQPKRQEINIVAIDSPLQVAAHAYSDKVLVCTEEKSIHATPKFERAKLLINHSGMLCFISGTAAIRGEESMRVLDVRLQTKQTIENIRYLIAEENLKRHGVERKPQWSFFGLRVYVKNITDISTVKSELEKLWADVTPLFVHADICRPELLVEIEGIAVSH